MFPGPPSRPLGSLAVELYEHLLGAGPTRRRSSPAGPGTMSSPWGAPWPSSRAWSPGPSRGRRPVGAAAAACRSGRWGRRSRTPAGVHPAFKDVIARAVAFRAVDGATLVSDPRGLAPVQESIGLGEQARVFPEVPLRLKICDDTYAVLTVTGRGEDPRHKIGVRPSGFLDALIDLFECYWRMSVPLAPWGPADLGELADDEGRQLLAHLTAGLTDASIARELRVSERTFGRRVARLQDTVGARTRFQLAAQASRRGWM